MKPWLKVLLWFGLGTGLGCFIGIQIGQRMERKSQDEEYADNRDDYAHNRPDMAYSAMNEYRGSNSDSGDISTVEGIEAVLGKTCTDEDDIPPMPTEEDILLEDIPALHPTQLIPQIISEAEYEVNEWEFDKERLVYYSGDDVLYNVETQTVETEPNNIVGIGTLIAGFGGDPKHPIDVIFVKNETFGTLYKVELIDDAFCDAVDGTASPEDDEPEEEDDFWNDV